MFRLTSVATKCLCIDNGNVTHVASMWGPPCTQLGGGKERDHLCWEKMKIYELKKQLWANLFDDDCVEKARDQNGDTKFNKGLGF